MLTRLREALTTRCLSAPHTVWCRLCARRHLASPVKQLLADAEALLYPATFDPLQADFTSTMAATDYALKAAIVPFIAAAENIGRRAFAFALFRTLRRCSLPRPRRGDVDIALLTPHSHAARSPQPDAVSRKSTCA